MGSSGWTYSAIPLSAFFLKLVQVVLRKNPETESQNPISSASTNGVFSSAWCIAFPMLRLTVLCPESFCPSKALCPVSSLIIPPALLICVFRCSSCSVCVKADKHQVFYCIILNNNHNFFLPLCTAGLFLLNLTTSLCGKRLILFYVLKSFLNH